MKRIICRVILLLSTAVLSACLSSNVSLHSGGLKGVDHSLTGLWFPSRNWHTHIYLHIMVDHDKNMRLIRVASPVSNRGTKIQLDEFYIFPTKIGKQYYMNLEFSNQDGDNKAHKKKYWFVKYKLVSPTQLKIWTLRSSAVMRAVQSGQLSGRAWLNGKQKRVSLYSSQKKLVAWLRQTKDRIDWNTPMIYKRLNKASYREY